MSHVLSEPGVSFLLVVCSFGVVLHLGVLGLALRRRMLGDDAGRWTLVPEFMAVGGVVLPLATALYSWRIAFASVQTSIIATDANEWIQKLALGMIRHANTSGFLCLGLVGLASLGGVALGLVLFARFRGERALLRWVAILGPIAAGGVLCALMLAGAAYSIGLIGALGAIASAAPNDQADLLRLGIEEAAVALVARAHTITLAGVLLFLVVSVLLSVAPVAPVQQRRRGVSAYGFFSGALLVSLGLTAEVWSTYQENTMPALPFSAVGQIVPASYVSSPEVTGNDGLLRAPMVTVSNEQLEIEGMNVSLQTLGEKLEEMRKVREMMHPDQPFTGELVLLVDREVTGARLMSVIEGARPSGYENGQFAFVKTGHVDRPRLGRIEFTGTSGAFVQLDPEADAQSTITVGESERFDDIARRIVAAQAHKQTTKLVAAR
ncbi:MAG: hypothetical protein IPK13_10020 [Deltaproteobacteria bacterium]|nr:hypothetical protein [Deltaproteobacteria bacterium]